MITNTDINRKAKMITKKDYNKISEIISKTETKPFDDNDDVVFKNDLVKELADYFEQDNPNFHRGKFIHACFNKVKKVA